MSYYNVCPICGSNLDPGEKCDCQKEHKPLEENTEATTAMATSWKPQNPGHKSKELQTA